MEQLLKRFGIGRLGVATISMVIGLAVRGVVLAAYLIATSRWLGPEAYGVFAGIVALTMLGAFFSGWGISQVISQRAAVENGVLPAIWSTSMVQVAVVGTILTVVIASIGALQASISKVWSTLLIVGFAELLIFPIAQCAVSALLVLQRSPAAALAVCAVPVGRLVVLGLVIAGGVIGTVETVAWAHAAGTIVGTILGAVLVRRALGARTGRSRLPLGETLASGTKYVAGNVVGAAYMEVDKILILTFLGAAILGPYTVAFRSASVFALPIFALVSVALPRMFAASQEARGRTFRAVVFAACIYGTVASLAICVGAPYVTSVFGQEFAASRNYLFFLAPWPVLLALRLALASGLTASGRQVVRVVIEGVALGFVVIANLLWLERWGVESAIAALLLAELIVILGCTIALSKGSRVRSLDLAVHRDEV